VVRDFNSGADFEKGTVFGSGLNYANQGLLQKTLDANGLKPVLASTTGTFNGTSGRDSGIASAASFAQWYNDAAAASVNTRNGTQARTLTLYRNSDGSSYVNRFGANGEQFQYTVTSICGSVTQSARDAAGNAIPCTACYLDEDPSTPQCDPAPSDTPCQTDPTYVGCNQNGSYWMGVFLIAAFDGTPVWFPADDIKPYSPSATAQIAGNYNPSWPSEPSGANHNFSFTTEVRHWFKYDSTQTYKLNIMGDDDIWVFINKHLAVDMGGIHTPVAAELSIAAGGVATVKVTPTNVTTVTSITSQPDLGGLQDGGVYEIAIFHAERMTKASSYQIGLPGFNTSPSICALQQ
jgi:fibro-slime domain-containing protein